MKAQITLVFLIILFSIPIGSSGQARYEYAVDKVTEDVYVLRPVTNRYRWVTSNIVVIINQDDVLVVDSGLLPSAAKAAIRLIGRLSDKPIKYLVNTHWHGDHWQGNYLFAERYPGIQIIATEEGAKGITSDGMIWMKMFYRKYFKSMIDGYTKRLEDEENTLTLEEKKELGEGIKMVEEDLAEIKEMKVVFPNTTFSEKMVITSGDREIQLHYLGRGNTRGDAVVYLPKEKVLITGDLVVFPSPYESGSFSRVWINTLTELAQFEYDLLIPGHGQHQSSPSYLLYLIDLFEETARQLNAAYLQGSSTLEEFQSQVNHETVTDVLRRNPEYQAFLEKLNVGLVPRCVENGYQMARDGKL